MAAASGSGVSGASRRTSAISAASAARSLTNALPPGKGDRPVNRCHHKQPQA